MGPDPAGGLRDVDHEVGRSLELVADSQHRHHRPEVGRERLLTGEQHEAAVLDEVVEVVDEVVVLDHLLGGAEIGVEHRLRGAADRLRRERPEPDDVGA